MRDSDRIWHHEETTIGLASEYIDVTLDLEKKLIKDASGFSARVEMDEFRRNCLVNGLDDIELTLQHEADIARFEVNRKSWMTVNQA